MRKRNFATVVYPESAPENWFEILCDMKIPAFVSPLHDKDINPGGEPKKPHYHVMLMFDGLKTKEQVVSLFDQIGGVGCEVVNSTRGYGRYLCHMDNPEKHQYSVEDVRALSGADYYAVISLALDRYRCLYEIIDFCIEHEIYCYSTLLEGCMQNKFEWFRVLCDGGLVVKEYLKSKRWSQMQAEKEKSEKE